MISDRMGSRRNSSAGGNGLCMKKPTSRSGRSRRRWAGASWRWKSCSQTTPPGAAMSATVAANRSLTAWYASCHGSLNTGGSTEPWYSGANPLAQYPR